MKFWISWACFILISLNSIYAKDVRVNELTALQKRTALVNAVKLEKLQAEKEAEVGRKKILADKKSLTAEVNKLKSRNKVLKKENKQLDKRLSTLNKTKDILEVREKKTTGIARELAGTIRINAKDLDAVMTQSLQSAFRQDRGYFLKAMLNNNQFPGINEVRQMVDLLFEEIQLSGEVRRTNSSIIDQAGEEQQADILVLGNFSAIYQLPEKTGFLLYSDKSRRLFALSGFLPGSIEKKLSSYLAGESDDVPMDISKGVSLRQLSGQFDLVEKISQGGPIIWPIVGIFILGLIIIAERMIYLLRRQINAEKFMDRINDFASKGTWDECEAYCRSYRIHPVPQVLLAGIRARDLKRNELENVLQETILRFIPSLEKFLSTLGMLASIAPLLGLLGTVTGMINTFHVITYFGTGDARMMSGGISEALVTTMLGLAVAIPIMFCHTLLSRLVENTIGQMEEKAVALVNTLEKIKAVP